MCRLLRPAFATPHRYIARSLNSASGSNTTSASPPMKQLFRVIGIAVLVSLGLSRPALGQKTYALGIGGGAAIPVGKLSSTQNTGYNGIVALAIGVAEFPIGVRLDGIYNSFLRNDLTFPAGSGAFSYNLRVMGALGNLIYAFPGSSAKPYIIVGGGLYNIRPDTAGAKSQNHFGFNAGLGATLGVGPFAIFLESRYHSIARKTAKGGVMQFVPITVGLMF